MRRKILWSVIITALNLLAIEFVLRMFGIGTFSQVIPDEKLGWRHLPNQTSPAARGGIVHINAHGLRDEDFPLAKPSGEFRVLMLGDSVTFGITIDQELTFCRLLHHALAGSCGPGAVRVMNAGVPGYDIQQHRVYLNERGFALDPDLVMLVFNQNDIIFNRESPTFNDFAGRHLLQRSAIFVFLDRVCRKVTLQTAHAKGAADPLNELIEFYSGDKPINVCESGNSHRVELGRRVTLQLKEDCAACNVRFTVVGLPRYQETEVEVTEGGRNRHRPDDLLQDMRITCNRNAIAYMDLLKPLAAVHPACWLPDRGHFSIEGHAAAARAIHAFLVSRRFVPVLAKK